jgi:GNAT superfamily N-acetyltransferase
MLPWIMRIDVYEPADVDAGTAEALAVLRNAAMAVDAPHLSPVSAEHVRLSLRYGHDAHPVPHLFVAVSDADDLVGYAEVHVSAWDNPHLASVELDTHPEIRGQDIDDLLYKAVVDKVSFLGRTLLISDAWVGSHREAFWLRHGFAVASRDAQRRLVTADLDWHKLDALHDKSVAASQDYDIVALPMPAPADLMPGLLELQRAMNDAPIDDLDLEDDVWSEERLRRYEQAMTARKIRLHRLFARRRSDGQLGGQTVVALDIERPHLGFQEDTSVVRSHRGHRLGLRLKIEMLRRLADLEPQIERIDTWNAESNTHMLAVNDAIGCFVVGRVAGMQKRLPAVQAQSWPSSRSSASSIVPS